MPGGGGSQSTTQSTVPWSAAQPFIRDIMSTAQQIYQGGPPTYFPGDPIAGFTAPQVQSQQATINRATAGSPLNRAAGGEIMKTLEGGYLSGENPYLPGIRGRVAREASQIAGALSGGGQSSMNETIARAVTEGLAPYEFQTLEAERGRMADAARFAPQLAQEDYRDISALGTVGAQQQAQQQAEIDAEMQRHQFEQQIPSQWLDWYSNLIRGQSSGYGTQFATAPSGPGMGQTIAGGIASIAPILALAAFSSERFKEDIEPADGESIAAKLATLPIKRWRYKGQDVEHVGPLAEEFARRFGVGDGKTLHLADVMGVVLAAEKERMAKGKPSKRRLLKKRAA